MKLAAIALSMSLVAAQGPGPEAQSPRAPSTGIELKHVDPLPPKMTEADEPTAQRLATAAVRPHRAGQADEKAAADAVARGSRLGRTDPDQVLFDQPEVGGPWWTLGSNFKASFATTGWTFVPQPLPAAEQLAPIQFRLAAVTAGSKALTVADARPRRNDRRITYDHGDVVQTIDVDPRGVQQRFLFASLPERGELVLDLAVQTALAGDNAADGIVFRGPFDHVTYSRAVAIDARGDRVAAATTYANGRVTIRVPAAFVAGAALPLIVDPRVAVAFVATNNLDLADPDVAFLSASRFMGPTSIWNVVYAKYFGGSDWDCYMQALDASMNLVDPPQTVDFTTNAWQRPRIASTTVLGPKLMVVAQVKVGTTPFRISARSLTPPFFTPPWTPGAQFDVATASVDSLHPDIGGDDSVSFRGHFFTVVWEHAYGPNDHDIFARQIDSSDALRGSTPTFIQTNTRNQTWPSISKHCGSITTPAASTASQRLAIVYQETANGSDEDIHGALLTFDGVIVPVNGSNTFPIDTSGHRDTFPQVSSPTIPDGAGHRRILAVYERTTSNSGDIAATGFDENGTVLARGNISILENDPTRLAWPQFRPSVDSEGLRFGVGYHEVYQGNTTVNDLDTRMSFVAITNSNTIVVEEAGAILGFTGNREFNIQVAALPNTGVTAARYCATNDRDNVNNTFVIDAQTYDGVPPLTFATRSTGCGSLTITPSGLTSIGTTATFAINASAPLSGFIAGSAASAPIGPCPGCTIGASGLTLLGTSLSVATPLDPGLIGGTMSVQGFVFDTSGGPCFGQIHLTDTIDFTVL